MAPTRPMPQGLPAVTSSQDVQAGSESGQTEIANNMDTVKTSDNEDQDELDVARMAEEMMKCTKRRREVRRDAIRSKHRSRVTKLEREINASFDLLAKPGSYKHRFEALGVLLKQKAAVEEQIALHCGRLEKAYMDVNREFSAVTRGRIEDITPVGNDHDFER